MKNERKNRKEGEKMISTVAKKQGFPLNEIKRKIVEQMLQLMVTKNFVFFSMIVGGPRADYFVVFVP